MQPPKWYASRLRAMSASEVIWRVGRLLPRTRSHGGTARPDFARDALATSYLDLARRHEEQVLTEADRIAQGDLLVSGAAVRCDPWRLDWSVDPIYQVHGTSENGADTKPILELHRQQHLLTLALGAG